MNEIEKISADLNQVLGSLKSSNEDGGDGTVDEKQNTDSVGTELAVLSGLGAAGVGGKALADYINVVGPSTEALVDFRLNKNYNGISNRDRIRKKIRHAKLLRDARKNSPLIKLFYKLFRRGR